MSDEKITQWFINNINGTPSEEQLALRKVYEQQQEIERLNKRIEDLNIINEEHRILNGMIRKQLKQKENIIKEAREYIDEMCAINERGNKTYCDYGDDLRPQHIIDILDKENKNEV